MKTKILSLISAIILIFALQTKSQTWTTTNDTTIHQGDSISLNIHCSCLFDISAFYWYNFNTGQLVYPYNIKPDTTTIFEGKYMSVVSCDSGITWFVDTVDVFITINILPTKQICYVSFDTTTYKNNIYFPTNSLNIINSFTVYKEVSLNVWDSIANVVSGTDHFTDTNCNPQNQSYSYKIITIDSIGRSAMSNAHTTITLLAAYDHGTNTYGFTWSQYKGITVTDYYLYGITSDGTTTQLGSVPGNQYFYNYVNPDTIYKKYFIGFPSPDCNSMKNAELVKSNYAHSISSGINDQSKEI